MSKELLAAFQTEILGPKDSDCGSKKTIEINLTNKNYKNFLYRYVELSPGHYEELTNENKARYVGKTVHMRSPMYCVGVGKKKCLCNKCAGNFYYNIDKTNIGLATARIATALTQANLQKFHQNLVKTHLLNVDDLVI